MKRYEMDITKRIEWLSKRVNLTEQDKEYVRFVMVETVTDAVDQVNKTNDIHDVSQRYTIEDIERCVENWGLCKVEKEYIERFLNGG